MFTIKAKNKDVTITGFDIASKRDVKSNVKVYTRTGDYEGNEKNASGWKKVFSSTQNLTTKNLSKLDMDAKQVTISAGETQSFYIYCKKGMLFARGDYKKLGNVFADDGVIEVSEGRASKRPFNNYKDYGQMMGVIRYVCTIISFASDVFTTTHSHIVSVFLCCWLQVPRLEPCSFHCKQSLG